MPASVAAKLAGVRADSSIFYYLDGNGGHTPSFVGVAVGFGNGVESKL